TLTSAVNDTLLFEVDAPLGWAVAISPTQVFVPAHDSTTAVVTISQPTPISITEPQTITITVRTQMDSVPQTVTNQILPSHRWFVPLVITSPAQ
ncbi:MAG: hypothetical protein KDD89_15285, partial [Anaerolineales bacterium]|nr:hypothetical protein [Anaerolineales bacterium]